MQIQPEFETLIDLFNKSLSRIKLLDKQCLEIIRTEREEKLTFEQLKTRAQDFALWLIQARDIRIKDKVAILGKNRADWDVALWGVVLAGAVPVLIDPERPVEGVKNHVIHTDARLIVMADDYQDADSRQQLKEWASGQGLGLIEMTSYEKTGSDNIETSACPTDEPCPPYETLGRRALGRRAFRFVSAGPNRGCR
jgi:acyl-CoA synthetase (AMP-forming)/AMP-acid ligase II